MADSPAEKEIAGEQQWREKAQVKASGDEDSFVTISGIPVDILHTPGSLPEFDYQRHLGFPGEFPYTRGIRHNMYRGRLWTMRQFAGFGSAADTNRRFKYLLDRGQTGLSTAFDMPTLMGYDSDHVFSQGEVGRCGVAIDSLEDMEILFDGIPLDKVSTSMTINAPAPSEKLRGTLQNDILKEYIAQKEWIFPPTPHMKLITDIMGFCAQHVPKWNTISISGYHIREAGSTAVQELAFTLADGFAYVQAGIDAGLDVDVFAPRLSFFFNAHMDFFEEIAKYRAARRIWARTMREKYGAKNPLSWLMRFHTQTAGCSLTAQQPENNIVRTAFQALSAVLGGTQSLHTNSMDESLALPSEKAVQIALRTQQIIAHETGVVNTIDPLGGSYFMESLTSKMEKGAEEYFRKIEAMGGVIAGIEKAFFQREIAAAASAYQKAVEQEKRVVVGVNRYAREDEEVEIELLRIDQQMEEDQKKKVCSLRARRNSRAVNKACKALQEAARKDKNLIPPILEAVKAYATLGEICDVLREIYGEYREPPVF
jgi:methylmalonyl-CoA mutase N-terminal domain/subunit